MLAAARTTHPREACGILLGEGNRITTFLETANVHPSPETHFEIDPQALIDAHRDARAGGPQVLGYFHSHPMGPARPSATDARNAARDGLIWAISGRAAAGDSRANSPDTLRGGKDDSSAYPGDTLPSNDDTLNGHIVTLWRDGDAGFTPLSYRVTTR